MDISCNAKSARSVINTVYTVDIQYKYCPNVKYRPNKNNTFHTFFQHGDNLHFDSFDDCSVGYVIHVNCM